MESTGEPMKVQVSKRFKEALEAAGCEGLELRPRMGPDGPGVYVKGKGQMETYWLTRAGWESENGTA